MAGTVRDKSTLQALFDTGDSLLQGSFEDLIATLLGFPRTAKANADTPYTAVDDDHVIGCDVSAGVLTINLPAGSTGKWFIIKDEGGDAATNNITIDANAAETIEGSLTKVLSTNFEVVRIYWTGTEWVEW